MPAQAVATVKSDLNDELLGYLGQMWKLNIFIGLECIPRNQTLVKMLSSIS